MDLSRDTGLRGLDAAALAHSRLLERLTASGIEIGQRYGLGFDFGVKYLPTTGLSVKSPESATLPLAGGTGAGAGQATESRAGRSGRRGETGL